MRTKRIVLMAAAALLPACSPAPSLSAGESPAWDFDWTVHVIDNYGVSDKHWGGTLAFDNSWEGHNYFHSSGTGEVHVHVTSGLVFLSDGSVCYSYGPSDDTYIY